ncbi:lysophospholipid acyltransferase family protein [Geopsychrobacter electrodiphilus]|uniref:lysophospholipid acyltransferase family protein n=1 Tax=Geopsychrobacter electrodiphilus TaxID=225196 RepID=UPI0003709B7F|nr:lysophospholipid acyltransferase family protein [Geopsychrobacter electrodiphilus]
MNISLIRRLWALLAAYVFGFYASLLNRFSASGVENIPSHGGVLIASNHISGFETICLPWILLRAFPLQMIWAPAKEELFRNPFLSALFRSWGAFPVRRGRDLKAGKQLGQLLETEKVMLFPEGTRHKDGNLGKGNRGVGKLIYDNRPVVIPTALTGLNHWKFVALGQKAHVSFGAPLDFTDLFALDDCKETHIAIVERLMAAIAVQLAANMGAESL